MEKILVVAAHPDDEILGCGGTIAKLISEGKHVTTLILGEGVTSRDNARDKESRREELDSLSANIVQANKVIGVTDLFIEDLPDNRFDTVPILDIVKIIEGVKNKVNPDTVFTHFENDLNIDHRITYNAVLTATRPVENENVNEIYSFEILSSTEWNYPLTFNPDVFFDISGFLEIKLEAMKEYKSELRKFPHPRSLKSIRTNAENWGIKTGRNYCEPFKLVRKII